MFTPTFAPKDYCFLEYLTAMLSLKTYAHIQIDPVILDTSRDDSKYFKVISQAVEEHPNIRVMHYEPNPKDCARMVHATALNIGRELALKEGFDWMLSVEADVILHSMDFINLWDTALKDAWLLDLKPAVVTGVVPYSKNATMLYRRLAVNYEDGRLVQPCSLPTIYYNKSFFTELEVEQFRDEKWIPQCEFYDLAELKEETFELAGCSLGFTLIPRAVLQETRFRHIEGSAAFPDFWFSFDVAKKGHRIFCNPKVRPTHMWRPWPTELKR